MEKVISKVENRQSVLTETANLTPIEVVLEIDEEGRTTARKLYNFLELAKGQFSRWAKTNILENPFALEGEDYKGFDIVVEGNLTKDYKLSASFAKKLAMGTHNFKGEAAKNYFIKVEEKIKEIAADPYKGVSKELKAVLILDRRTQEMEDRMDNLEDNMPLFNVECKELQALVRKTGINVLGGYRSPAYNDNSLRGRVYSDIQHQLKREFGVSRYEAIKRSQLDTAMEIVKEYKAPLVLTNEIQAINNQLRF